MFVYSNFFKPIFWIVMGLIYTLTAMAAPIWARELGFQMTWWKWVLVALWYLLINFSFAGSFTLMGEKEPGAWYKFLGFHLVISIIFGGIVLYVL
jgi:hypothetical protein